MVTRALRIAAAAIGVLLSCSSVAVAQSRSGGVAVLTGGVTLGDQSGGAVGGEGRFEFPAPFDIGVEGGHFFKVDTPELRGRAQRIATGLGVSATPVYRVTYVGGAVRFRFPSFAATQPYVTIGTGVARVTTDTSFSAGGATVSPSGLQLGADLTGHASKPYVTAGGGLSWTMATHLVVEASYRYARILPRTSLIPNDTAITTHRVQAGVGVRF
jgi:opacity protein-like surface antigen